MLRNAKRFSIKVSYCCGKILNLDPRVKKSGKSDSPRHSTTVLKRRSDGKTEMLELKGNNNRFNLMISGKKKIVTGATSSLSNLKVFISLRNGTLSGAASPSKVTSKETLRPAERTIDLFTDTAAILN